MTKRIYILLEEMDVDDYGNISTAVFKDIFSSYYDVIRFIQSIPKDKDSNIYQEGGRGYFRLDYENTFNKYDKKKYGDGIKYLTDIQVCIEQKYSYRYFIVLYKEI